MSNLNYKKIKAFIVSGILLSLFFGNLIVLRIYFPLKIDRLLEKCEESYQKQEYKKAEIFGLDLISTCEAYDKMNFWPWNYWNYGNAIHIGNVVLGLIALNKNDLESAKSYLILAGKTPGSPQLDTYGPNMILARELLVKGEKDTVIRYFELCRHFWDDNGRLVFWAEKVKKDMMPTFDNRLLKL